MIDIYFFLLDFPLFFFSKILPFFFFQISGQDAPKLKNLAKWLMEHPNYDVDPQWADNMKERSSSLGLLSDLQKRLSASEKKHAASILSSTSAFLHSSMSSSSNTLTPSHSLAYTLSAPSPSLTHSQPPPTLTHSLNPLPLSHTHSTPSHSLNPLSHSLTLFQPPPSLSPPPTHTPSLSQPTIPPSQVLSLSPSQPPPTLSTHSHSLTLNPLHSHTHSLSQSLPTHSLNTLPLTLS